MSTKRYKTERRLDSETIVMLNAQREAFWQQFGRDPGPDDPLFFDPEAPVPRPIDRTEVDEALLELLAAFDEPGEFSPGVKAGNAGGVRALHRNQHDVAEAVAVEACGDTQERRERVALARVECLGQSLDGGVGQGSYLLALHGLSSFGLRV